MSRLKLDETALKARLGEFIAAAAGAAVRNLEATPLSGGAIQENWLVSADVGGRREDLVLRTDAPSRVAFSHGRAEEYAILQAAFRAGVSVPEPLWFCGDTSVLGRVFYLMRRVDGIAVGYRVVKDKSLGGDRVKLAERLGAELARIHGIKPGTAGLDFLAMPKRSPALDHVTQLRGDLDARPEGFPVLELGLRWAERNAPPPGEIVLVHQDFRSGNYMVDEKGLRAVLDWEFGAWGEPMADIGWFCAKCWRYGENELEAGGIAPRADFYRGYEVASGRRIAPDAVHYWEVMAHLRWAVIALQQADRHIHGSERSLELALTGRVLPELELTIIELIAPGPWPKPAPSPAAAAERPEGAVLLAEARRVMLEELLPLLPEERRYEARMAANAMAIAGRELSALRPSAPELKSLASAIRAGRHDENVQLRDSLAADVLARLAISNPRALPATR
jgi:aminoglycoside phosphotransferase (APT) family kinase protein